MEWWEKIPEKASDVPPVAVVFFAFWGGFLSAVRRFASGKTFREKLVEALLELIGVPFWMLITYTACLAAGFSFPATLLTVAYLSHIGTRHIVIFGRQFFGKFINGHAFSGKSDTIILPQDGVEAREKKEAAAASSLDDKNKV